MALKNLESFLKEKGFETFKGIENIEIWQPLSIGAAGGLPEAFKNRDLFHIHVCVSSWGTSCYITIWRGSAVNNWMADWNNNRLMFRLSDHSTGVYRMIHDSHRQVESEEDLIERVKNHFNF